MTSKSTLDELLALHEKDEHGDCICCGDDTYPDPQACGDEECCRYPFLGGYYPCRTRVLLEKLRDELSPMPQYADLDQVRSAIIHGGNPRAVYNGFVNGRPATFEFSESRSADDRSPGNE